jgi:glycosyltransferase involved in cell wall biosynthesis
MARKKISIVCATIDSIALVKKHLSSIENAVLKTDWECEFLLIDQTVSKESENLCSDTVSIKYFHSDKLGLSYNRNIGLLSASGDWIMCSDADVLFDENFFSSLDATIKKNLTASIIFGRVLSIETRQAMFRKWPKKNCSISLFKRWTITTTHNGIWHKTVHKNFFDIRFGVGSGLYGSCEDVDFFLSLIGDAVYSPDIIVCHPFQDANSVPLNKAVSYSHGFGALCRKHFFPFGVLVFVLSIVKKTFDVLRGQSPKSYYFPVLRARFLGLIKSLRPVDLTSQQRFSYKSLHDDA